MACFNRTVYHTTEVTRIVMQFKNSNVTKLSK